MVWTQTLVKGMDHEVESIYGEWPWCDTGSKGCDRVVNINYVRLVYKASLYIFMGVLY